MWKYVKYVLLVLFIVVRKIVGLVWIFAALPFRKYARNTVYNYILANDGYLVRLQERPIRDCGGIYVIDPYHGTDGGYISKRKVSWIEYQLVVWFIWGWLDDDSNEDTFSRGYKETILKGERLRWLPKFIIKALEEVPDVQFGNSFDRGDAREPAFYFWATWLWTIRNTAYNFKYLLHEEKFEKNRFNWKGFGYNDEGRLVIGGLA